MSVRFNDLVVRLQELSQSRRGRAGLVTALAAGSFLAGAFVVTLPFLLLVTASAASGDFSLDFVAAKATAYVHQGVGEGNETSANALQYADGSGTYTTE